MYSFDDSVNDQNLWIWVTISPKAVLIFSKNFFDFGMDMIEKLGIVNFSSYSSKISASVVLSDSKVTFLGEGKDRAFYSFLSCVLFIHRVA